MSFGVLAASHCGFCALKGKFTADIHPDLVAFALGRSPCLGSVQLGVQKKRCSDVLYVAL